jgi:hypothetical protein
MRQEKNPNPWSWRLVALLPGMLLGLPAAASTLEAQVIGSAGAPKPYVRVELAGPERLILFTNERGKLSRELPGGSYVLTVSERNRRQDFPVQVPREGTVSRKLTLEW